MPHLQNKLQQCTTIRHGTKRVVTLWNRLPAATVLAQNLKQFKKALMNTDLS